MADFITNFLTADIRTATPLLLAALGLVFSERAGIVNIGTEGIMLVGALLGCLGAALTGSSAMGALLAIAGGFAMALIFAFFTITLRSNQIVVGTAFNIFAGGFTITLNRLLLNGEKVAGYEAIPIPGLSKIPILGEVLFNWSFPVYLAFLSVPVCWFVLQRTNIGLKVRAVGEYPKACDTVGINVFRIRYGAVLFSGMMAGFARLFCFHGAAFFLYRGHGFWQRLYGPGCVRIRKLFPQDGTLGCAAVWRGRCVKIPSADNRHRKLLPVLKYASLFHHHSSTVYVCKAQQ